MAENGRGTGLMSEGQKGELVAALIAAVTDFLKQDAQINASVARMANTVANEVEKNPKMFFESRLEARELEALLQELRSKGEGGVTGGAISLPDLGDFIKQVSEFVKDEKGFFKDLITKLVS